MRFMSLSCKGPRREPFRTNSFSEIFIFSAGPALQGRFFFGFPHAVKPLPPPLETAGLRDPSAFRSQGARSVTGIREDRPGCANADLPRGFFPQALDLRNACI
ncbi:hypothetical protein DCO57_22660 [Labrenzia sp. 011]|nr:hypothetical protein DCO57_22660 [Labrenzia sp. 011]